MPKGIVWTEQAKADVRRIEQPVAWQILKTLGRYVLTGEGNPKLLQGIEPPLIRLRAQNHRVFFREHGDHIKVERVLDRKEAYR
ncbi:MAG: type II toxin-antitoxin system RelE/ParE family toxin [Bryobacterales bacterium]|nr:type II toxin-antitoxin system RelE/ParE family toxin [Bryobacterales bacterium]